MQSKMALITFIDDGGGMRPDNSLPGSPNYPTTGPLPPGGALLPVYPFDPTRPDNSLPGSQPGVDNTLPGQPGYGTGQPVPPGGGNYPSHQPIVPGKKFVVKYLACAGLILVPDNSLPPTPEPK
jgi:hypothetical protein